jgi:hypothetical protein
MQRTFVIPVKVWSSRPITVKINEKENAITFHFKNEHDREFYWISISDWKSDMFTWSNHMKEKIWFIRGMEDFINSSIK